MQDTLLPKLHIPETMKYGPEHDVSTRLGRAYERMIAFTEMETSLVQENTQQTMAVGNGQVTRMQALFIHADYAPADDTSYALIDALSKRRKDIQSIKDALQYELAEAKQEAGQWKNVLRKPAKSIAEWDAELSKI